MGLKNPNLPEEILIEIFSRTTAKSVGRCRCLSKTWRTQLSTSQFAKLHLLNRTTNTANPLLNSLNYTSLIAQPTQQIYSLHTIDAPIVDNTAVSRKLELGVAWNEVLGCCNGLVLLSNIELELFSVNPITLQHFKLPSLSSGLDDIKYTLCGLGYDSLSDDYKVLRLSYGHVGVGLIDVYSVKSGAWKRAGTCQDCFPTRRFGAFVNGAIHWRSIRKRSAGVYVSVINAFDLAGDVFHEIPAALMNASINACKTSLRVLERCLCMSTQNSSGNIELWMMKQYGLADSWTKLTTVTDVEWVLRLPLCFIGDREKIVLVTCDNDLVVYNLKDGTKKDMVVDGVPASFPGGVAFVDSLVSPNHQYSN